ncbi:MAG: hypothetical protein QOC63_4457 [Mycobacterium sp.]|jgi:hypothetical protein|nr:hypothetical protein [Mycobacterium sp.]
MARNSAADVGVWVSPAAVSNASVQPVSERATAMTFIIRPYDPRPKRARWARDLLVAGLLGFIFVVSPDLLGGGIHPGGQPSKPPRPNNMSGGGGAYQPLTRRQAPRQGSTPVLDRIALVGV